MDMWRAGLAYEAHQRQKTVSTDEQRKKKTQHDFDNQNSSLHAIFSTNQTRYLPEVPLVVRIFMILLDSEHHAVYISTLILFI